MKKTLLVIVIILAVIIALPLINLIRWTFQSKKPMNVILVDKTVPTVKRENHRAISWVMANLRVVDKDHKSNYNFNKDYYGWHTLRPERVHNYEIHDYRTSQIIELADKNDVLYIADTYGVYFTDWYLSSNKSRKPRKLYGGLNNTDFLVFKEMKDRKKLIILEYNTFDFPTDNYNAWRIQDRIGMQFNGWTGRYFASLDSNSHDLPGWMPELYRKEHKKPWTFSKPGLVLVSQKNIIVLEEGVGVTDPVPHIVSSPEMAGKYGVLDTVAFGNWFDIIEPVSCSVISNYQIKTTALGDSLLMKFNLTNQFPAVVKESDTSSVYYFAGNFAYSTKPVWTSMFKGIEKIKRLHYTEKTNDTNRFFWLYYKPLVSTIFTDYYSTMR